MKALRFFFLSLLAAFSFAASAQTIEIYKDGRIIDSFTAAQVDSVVYTPTAAQPRYYYYAGWDCPSSVEDLENFIIEKAGKSESEGNGKDFIAGYVTTLEGWGSLNPIVSTSNTSTVPSGSKSNWYVCLPYELNIYVDVFGNIINNMDAYTEIMRKVFDGVTYILYKSNDRSFDLDYIIIG